MIPVPRHVAIIMDGNGRWASARGLPREHGHRQGAEAVRRVVRAAREMGLPHLTLYAFSAQNWDRPRAEVDHLMQLLRRFAVEEASEILARGIRLLVIGEVQRLPVFARVPLSALQAASAGNRGMTLCLALSYGGREGLAAAARALAREVAAGRLRPDQVDVSAFARHLETACLPPVDLLIRTSGEQRLSNFLLWESAYAELHFTTTLWPDFDRAELERALEVYGRRERRFGAASARAARQRAIR